MTIDASSWHLTAQKRCKPEFFSFQRHYESWDKGHATTFHGMLPWLPWHKPEKPPGSLRILVACPRFDGWKVLPSLSAASGCAACRLSGEDKWEYKWDANGIQMGRHHLSSSDII